MKGLILSGGKGTRLYPLTYTRAKQLIPVANKPVLVRVIEAIRDAGIEEIGIVTGDTGPEIRERIGDGSTWGVLITYIPQDEPKGLAHAVKISRDFLGDERFVMFLGDNVIEGGIASLIEQFGRSKWNSQIVLTRVTEPQHYGVAELKKDGGILRLVEKPKEPKESQEPNHPKQQEQGAANYRSLGTATAYHQPYARNGGGNHGETIQHHRTQPRSPVGQNVIVGVITAIGRLIFFWRKIRIGHGRPLLSVNRISVIGQIQRPVIASLDNPLGTLLFEVVLLVVGVHRLVHTTVVNGIAHVKHALIQAST